MGVCDAVPLRIFYVFPETRLMALQRIIVTLTLSD